MIKLTQEKINYTLVVRINGRLGAASVRDYRDDLISIVDSAEKSIVLNLAGVEFIDSSGLGLLVSLLKHAREHDATLNLCNLTPQVKSLFELTRMTRIFSIYNTEEMALQSVD